MRRLLINGANYKLREPRNEDKEFTPHIVEHAKEIFGENSIYFDIKRKLTTIARVDSIPDGFAVDLEARKFYMVEAEPSSHDVYGHIVSQLGKFIDAVDEDYKDHAKNRRKIIESLYEEIERDPVKKAFVTTKVGGHIHKFLTDVVFSDLTLVVLIEKKQNG